MSATINIEHLAFEAGADILVKRALASLNAGDVLRVEGSAPGLEAQLRAFARRLGHGFETLAPAAFAVRKAPDVLDRWADAAETGAIEARVADAVLGHAAAEWGLAARGARVEKGTPAFRFRFSDKSEVWSDDPLEFYRQAVAAQWKPEEAIDWESPIANDADVERALVQILTYMIENENAALVIPAKFLAQMHPHFREIQAILAMQVADEARHIDIFTRRIALSGRAPGVSGAGGQQSLKSLVDEPDFTVAGFLLSVLGEGTFVNLLNFLAAYAPDPVTLKIMKLAARDEARHVAFGMAHLEWRLAQEPAFRDRLARAVEQRHEALASTEGLNQEVFDSLVIYAGGGCAPAQIEKGFADVQHLYVEMAMGRCARMLKLGFDGDLAMRLATLHTRNFM